MKFVKNDQTAVFALGGLVKLEKTHTPSNFRMKLL